MGDKRLEASYPSDSWFSEIEKILSFVKKGQSVQLIGIPGVGRSNLLGLLSYNRDVRIKHLGEDEQVKYHFVLINFSEIKDQPFPEVFKFIFLSLIDSLRLRNILKDPDSKNELEVASSIFKNSLATGDNLVIFNALKRTIDFLCLERGLSIIFLFDRFEEYTPNVTSEFFANLRALRNRAKYKFSAVFSLKRPIEDILEPEIYFDFNEFLQGNTIYLPISDKPSLDFRIKHLEDLNRQEFPETILQNVLKITAGHGKLTRLCLEQFTILNSKFSMNDLLSNDKIKNSLLDIWGSLTPEEQSYLKSLNGTTPEHLVNVSLIKDPSAHSPGSGQANSGQVQITIPLLEEFVPSASSGSNDKFVFDTSANEIKRGEVVYSHGLTALEFKLFKFLIENEEKILSRDEIVNAVWGDLKSTQGVTDQAIDQLTFRLRKKVEQDPNNPGLIQTIKGRGIIFRQ